MNYAVPIARAFATGRAAKTRLSKEARSIRRFCATHTVKVYDDPQKGEVVVDVAEIKTDNDTDQRNK